MAISSTRTRIRTPIVKRQPQYRQPVRYMDRFDLGRAWLEPTNVYERKPSSSPGALNAHHVLQIGNDDLSQDASLGSPSVSLLGGDLGDAFSLTWPSGLSPTRWFDPTEVMIGEVQEEVVPIANMRIGSGLTETGLGSLCHFWMGTVTTLLENNESTIERPPEWLRYERSSAGRETWSANEQEVLNALQFVDPRAVEKIKRLTNLEPNWDGYGGTPPTEEAVKATAKLLLETHQIEQGLLESLFIAPLPEGGLELEWDLDSGAELMLVIPSTGTVIRYLLDEPTSSGRVIESEGVLSKETTLEELIRRLTL